MNKEEKSRKGFDEALKFGEMVEGFVLRIIQGTYPDAYKKKGYCKGYDLVVPEVEIKLEVKSDVKSRHTGNYVIEVEYGGTASGLTTTESDFWVFYNGDQLVWVKPENISKAIKQSKLELKRFKGSTDVHEKAAYLINKDILHGISDMITELNGRRLTE